MRNNVYLLCLFFFSLSVRAQSPFAPLNSDYYHLIDRLEIRQDRWADGFHSSIKPYNRQSIIQLTDSILAKPTRDLSDSDYFNLDYLRDDSWEWVKPTADDPQPGNSREPLFRHFYKKKADFYNLQTEDVDLHISPAVYFGAGVERASYEASNPADGQKLNFINSRGVELRGSIGKKLGFYSFFSENQAIYPEYIQQYGRTYSRYNGEEGSAPGEGFTKNYRTNGVDFLSARGYITFNALKVINIQFGHDRNFIGNGFRSLLLSDNSAPYLFAKFSTRLGKRIQYTNLFTHLQNSQNLPAAMNVLIPPKFAAMHHLSVNVSDHVNIGLFEAEVFSRDRVDLSYLNPIIFYRYVESSQGSADNALIGLDAKVNFLSQFLVYGQVMLDEFVLRELTRGRGSWTNKFAVQLGGKYIDAFDVPNLDLQLEMNLARPYTYSHGGSSTVSPGQTNYVHYSQPLAHPLGANFMEGLGIVRFQRQKLSASGIFGIMMYGADPSPDRNYGGNILQDYNTRIGEDGNHIGQGRKTIITYGDIRGSYMIRHNVFLEARYLYRFQDSEYRPARYSDQVASLAVRWNIPYRNWVF
ncbi:hypothetical protein [Spirosoma sp. KUDC1026]|uniref:hypothetical protein n=1 Tax=Spirosoma sp. KUDC1026 TaxID=2745947 RepID=UPI00159BEBE9|nr:hypothetical protein [Spirosoma sp. KUDC1026]QKZ15601.1 hypothetical protein HU175_24485 [Spirosoma sp. KUDC1026]